MSLRQNAFVLLVLVALLAIVGDWALDADAARWWRLPAGLLLLGLAYERVITGRARFKLEVNSPQRWLLARPGRLTLHFSQGLRRRLTLQVAPRAPAGFESDGQVQSIEVIAGQAAQIGLGAVARRLGKFAWPSQAARVAGPLGLAWWPLKLTHDKVENVVPDRLDYRESASGAMQGGARISSRSGTGPQVSQLRSYRPGDPLRVIDWKATARRRQLISREFAEDQHLDIIVAIDAGRSSGVWCGDLDRLGYYVNATARFAEHAVAQDDRVGVVVFADRPLAALPPGRGLAAVTRIRSVLARLEVQAADSNPIHAAAHIRTLVQHRALVILLTDIEDAASSSQLVTAVRLLQPKHLPLVVGVVSKNLEDFASGPARDWLDPYYRLAAEIQRSQRERSVQALHALGVPALVTRPEMLERSVFENYASFRRRRRV